MRDVNVRDVKKPKILVIEDEYAMQMVLEEYLSFSYDVKKVDTGKQAFEAMQETSFNAIVVDLHLPDMSGMEIVKKVAGKNKKVAILILTGDMMKNTVQKAKEVGADDYIIKPVEKKTLLERVEKAILRRAVSK